MAKRIRLWIDHLLHINDVVFKVYRDTTPEVDENSTHIMSVKQSWAVHHRLLQENEALERDPDTPYAFLTKRHFLTDQRLPEVFVGLDPVHPDKLELFPADKTIEVHTGDMGLFDGRTIYANYEYEAIPMWDDYDTESGKMYFGPPATGLRPPLDFTVTQQMPSHKILISCKFDRYPITYYYRIQAIDSDGNVSDWSDIKAESLSPTDIFIRIERSPDGEHWEPVALTTNEEWLDILLVVDIPLNVQNAQVFPVSSKEAIIRFDNPMYHYKSQPRISYQYRIRAEDDQGEHTDWLYLGPFEVVVRPKQLLIRRKLNNGKGSTKDQTDAFTVFTINQKDLDPEVPTIELIDDQLTDANIYSYTFFYEDETGKEAEPFFLISDHTPWKNIILFGGHSVEDPLTDDFIMTFTLTDDVIDIGTEEGTA